MLKNRGVLFAIGAYGIWGFLPIYWKFLQGLPAIEILLHRMVWSLIFLIPILTILNRWGWVKAAFSSPRTFITYLTAAVLLAVNWGIYIYGVNIGLIVETSLGYFINPLVSVLLGVLFFREKLRPIQWLAVGSATLGVLYLTIAYGEFPWIAVSLAATFGIYGLLKKIAPLGAFEGLTFETMLLFLPAVGALLFLEWRETGAFGHVSLSTTLLLVGTGVATAVPLLFFAAAASRIPLSTIGILQYIAPTLQLLIGVFVYGEPFQSDRQIGFSLIWFALLIYTAENIYVSRKEKGNRAIALDSGD